MVSSLGKVISLGRSITNNLGTRYQQPHVVAPCAVSSGYIMVRLWKNNKEQKFYIHRLVAISFIPNEHEYPEVDHIDCDKLNNKISNLRWCTRRMNQNNPITRVRNSISKKNHPKLKEINSKVVIRINPKNAEEIKFYKSCRSAKDDGFCESKVSAVCRGERPHHKGYNGTSYPITKILSTSQRTLVQSIMISNHNHIHRCYKPPHTGIHIRKVLNNNNLDSALCSWELDTVPSTG